MANPFKRWLIVLVSLAPLMGLSQTSEPAKLSSFGSGFVVSSGYLVTANHVVANAQSLWVGPVAGDKWARAQVIKTSEELDLALLSMSIPMRPLNIANWASVPIGLEVFAIGYPEPAAQGLSKKITQGIINGLKEDRAHPSKSVFFQFSAEVNKGSSGGPVLSSDGLVVGVVLKKLDALTNAERLHELTLNVNYALKSSYLIEFLKDTPAQAAAINASLRTQLRPYEVFEQSSPSVLAVIGKKGADPTAASTPNPAAPTPP